MILLGIDFGDRRMGLAVCDKDERMAVSIGAVSVRGARHAAQKAAETARERKAEKIIVGMPFRADGFRGERCEKTEVFLSFLKELLDVAVETVDESFTTTEAHSLLFGTGLAGKKHIRGVDALSAQLILQSYLDKNRS